MQNQKDNNQNKNEAPKTEAEEHRDERIEKTGQLTLSDAASGEKIHLLTIIGEIEGHDNLSGNSKTTKYEHILEHLPKIDQMINEAAKGWKTSRMGKVDLTLIRLAVYEMKYEEDIPTGVAINEAVELAKRYGTDDSASFVNGILAKLT
mgnify:CR=1 FL=1